MKIRKPTIVTAVLVMVLLLFPWSSIAAIIAVPQTGMTEDIPEIAGDDGEIQAGVPLPIPRFTDNGDGTVTDNLTGLVWLKNANCLHSVDDDVPLGPPTWSDALVWANELADGQCGLQDGSSASDWRMPNIRELVSLMNFNSSFSPLDPSLDSSLYISNTQGTGPWQEGDPFTGVQHYYWTSTNDVESIGDPAPDAHVVNFYKAITNRDDKATPDTGLPPYAWAVRDLAVPFNEIGEIPQTGQDADESTEARDDGALEMGVGLPDPRFVEDRDGTGTVTDMLTGLVWLKNANCFGPQNWATAITLASELSEDDGDCGLAADASGEGSWRLPNILELWSLVDFKYFNPSLTDPLTEPHPFDNVQTNYWSSTYIPTHPNDEASNPHARFVDFLGVLTANDARDSPFGVWPVREGPDYITYHALTVLFAGQGEGTVTATDLHCTEYCSQSYQSGTSLTLTAAPAQGSSFIGWSGTGCTGSSESIVVEMNGDITCTATFKNDGLLLLMMPAIIGGREDR